jgi:O-antigen/teichoic acid export membrane protein
LIANHWLQSKQLAPQTVSHAVILMGLVLACRWPIGLYQGALIGAQRLTISSAINMAMVTIGSGGAIAVLAYVSSTIEAFFIWQVCVGLVYVIAMRAAAWRVIGRRVSGGFDRSYVRRVLRFSLGVGAISLSGLVLTQLDKIILSKVLGLDSFGEYMLATAVASSLYMLIVPVFNVISPNFSSLVAQQNFDDLLRQYRIASRWLATLLFPTAMTLILLAQPLISVWTGNEVLANNVAPLVSLLFCAYALHGVMHMPYALMLAQGDPRPMFVIYIGLIALMVPLTTVLSLQYGAAGGAFAQLSLFVFYLFVGTWVTHKRHLKGVAGIWLSKDIGVPLSISTLVGLCGYFAMQLLQVGLFKVLLVGLVCWVLATLLSVYSSRHSRTIIVGYWNEFRYR